METLSSKYILITAAHNEERFIERTISSVTEQLCKPAEWIIVSDGSTDSTEIIIDEYARSFSFIKLVIKKREGGHNFSSKVSAINTGLTNISVLDYDFIGILDADVSFERDYYKSLINEFKSDPKLGIVGGKYFDIVQGKKIPVYSSPYSVRGATQFFRRKCFEGIGGIESVKYGGEDALACYKARMHNWNIKNLNNAIVFHHRPTGNSMRSIFKIRFRDGRVEYNLGYHPIFQFVKCIKRITERPIILGSILRFVGFIWGYIINEKRTEPKNLLKFIRHDQLIRVFKIGY